MFVTVRIVIASIDKISGVAIMHNLHIQIGNTMIYIFYLTTPQGAAITDQAALDVLADDLVRALEARKAA